IAVAGFSESELSIEAKENTLTVKGQKQAATDAQQAEVLYQGIAARAFERVFRLADFVEVRAASLENGLLHIDLVREIPEAMKPRAIRITETPNGKVVEAKAAAKPDQIRQRRPGNPGASLVFGVTLGGLSNPWGVPAILPRVRRRPGPPLTLGVPLAGA